MSSAALFFEAARAAGDLLADVYRIDVRKALDPLNPKDFEKIVAGLGHSLAKKVVPVEDAALKKAIQALERQLEVAAPRRAREDRCRGAEVPRDAARGEGAACDQPRARLLHLRLRAEGEGEHGPQVRTSRSARTSRRPTTASRRSRG